MPINFSKKELSSDNNSKQSIIDKINEYLLKFSRVPIKERLFFVQHLGLMLKSGISLSIALYTLANQTKNKYFQKILNNVGKKVEEGASFAEALKPHQKIFGEMFISMIEAGELSGKLESVLNELFIQIKKEHKLISKIKGALTYPAVILMAMFGIGTFMIIVVVPKITAMFNDLDAELPLPTKILIKISEIIRSNGIISAISFVLIIVLITKILKTEKGKYIFHGLLLKMPILSPIIKKINLARFSRNISSLLKTDIMIIKSFKITAKVISNLHYRKVIMEMAEKIKKGGKLNEIIKTSPKLFPPVVTQMIAVGEETGELDNILIELAEFYEEEVDQIMENLPSIIEPLLILTLGLGVGGIAIAVIMPMYSITSAM